MSKHRTRQNRKSKRRATPKTTITLPTDDLGEPGSFQTLHFVPQEVGQPPRNPAGDTQVKRPFEVWSPVFNQAPLWSNSIQAGPTYGDSLVFINKSKVLNVTGGPPGKEIKFELHSNPQGRIGTIRARVDATSWLEARKTFREAVHPVLSALSWRYQIPISLGQLGGRDVANDIVRQDYIAPRRSLSWDGRDLSLDSHLRAAYSFFREGMNTASPAYRLLCFDKTIQMLMAIRARYVEIAETLGTSKAAAMTAMEVKVGSNDEAVNLWPQCTGWTVGRLRNDLIRPLRNQVAHELTKESEDFNNLDSADLWDITRQASDCLVPLLKRFGDLLETVATGLAVSQLRFV